MGGRVAQRISSPSTIIDGVMILAYYNAGSAALVLILIALAIAAFFWCRIRRNRVRLPTNTNIDGGRGTGEENIPLRSAMGVYDENGIGQSDEEVFRKRKGKERAVDEPTGEQAAIFDVGDSDDEDGTDEKR